MFRNKSANVHQFSMVPAAHIPRSSFRVQHTHKTTFDSGYLVPVYVDEVLPGDSFRLKMTAFSRLSTPLFPIMDNLHMESFFFFVPYRLIWDNWQKFMGEQKNPGDSISYLIPQQISPAGGYPVNSLQDYMGLPTVGQVGAGNTVSHSAAWLRAYNLIYNEWFRDENLQDSAVVDTDDGPDTTSDYFLRRRGKRHDYFTSCLPWPQKGESVTLPLGTTAPVLSTGQQVHIAPVGDTSAGNQRSLSMDISPNRMSYTGAALGPVNAMFSMTQTTGLYADLSAATAATINQLRQSFQVQKLLERDARGGTRYTEIIRAHFGVIS